VLRLLGYRGSNGFDGVAFGQIYNDINVTVEYGWHKKLVRITIFGCIFGLCLQYIPVKANFCAAKAVMWSTRHQMISKDTSNGNGEILGRQ
jgi:hypothetical protein